MPHKIHNYPIFKKQKCRPSSLWTVPYNVPPQEPDRLPVGRNMRENNRKTRGSKGVKKEENFEDWVRLQLFGSGDKEGWSLYMGDEWIR